MINQFTYFNYGAWLMERKVSIKAKGQKCPTIIETYVNTVTQQNGVFIEGHGMQQALLLEREGWAVVTDSVSDDDTTFEASIIY